MSQAIQRYIMILIFCFVVAVAICVFLGIQNKSLKEQSQSLQEQLMETKSKQEKALAASQQLQQEINAELKAPGSVKRGMRSFFTGNGGEAPAPGVPAPAPTGKWKITPAN